MRAVVVDPQPLGLPLDHLTEGGRRRRDPSLRKLSIDTDGSSVEQPLLFPLRAVARLPVRRAHVAELPSAAAGHVVAAICQLDEMAASWAAPPTLLGGKFQNLAVGLRVTGLWCMFRLFALTTGA